MDCGNIVRDEVAERYLLGELSPAEQESYEKHYFDCERCFAELRSLQAIQDVLRTSPPVAPAPGKVRAWNPWWGWLAGGAVAASLVAAVLLYQHRGPAVEPVASNQRPERSAWPPESAKAPGVISGQPPEAAAGAEVTEAPASVPNGSSKSPGTDSQRSDVLVRLARVDPPRYAASVLRGVTDEATLKFRAGMKFYAAGNYQSAVPILREAANLDPNRPDFVFFLGVSELLSGNAPGAVKDLKRTIAIGETPFLEEAHFYLAKTYLKQGDVDQARAELMAVNALHGERSSEAGEVLGRLATVPSD